MSSPFTIYSASAGSGKTYQITKHYLQLLLGGNSNTSFKHILALTFTNKAVNEMKSRIINSLFEFSSANEKVTKNPLFKDLCETLELSPEQLQHKAKNALHSILHNYGFFEVSTLDKFTHRIIRTFAKDLKLSQHFEVALDTQALLIEAVDLLLNQAGTNELLTKTLVDFSLAKIENDKSWNIANDLFDVGKLLFQENHNFYVKHLSNYDVSFFEKLTKLIKERIRNITNELQQSATSVLDTITTNGFEFSDFPRETLPNHFKKIAAGTFHPKTLYSNSLEEQLKSGVIVKKTVLKSADALAAIISPEFLRLKQHIYKRQFLSNALNNLVPLSLLNEIAKQLEVIKVERDLIPISEFNTIIANEIKNQPAPFIYERLGEKFQHYFIDEFQDTSQMQWENLVPLIANSIEGGQGQLMLVGDAKQAIYRWRGGRAEQFVDLFTLKHKPFTVTPKVFALDTNWRSTTTIVNFNNTFFTSVAKDLSNIEYVDFYISGNQQKTNTKDGGYVSIAFVEKQTTAELQFNIYADKVLATVKNCFQLGYQPNDVCILVRKNSHGVQLAEFLMSQGYEVISPDALLIGNNRVVCFIVQLLYFLNDTNDLEAAFEVLQYLSNGKQNRHNYICNSLTELKSILKDAYGFDATTIPQKSVYDIVEEIIARFNLTKQSSAFVMKFLDVVFEFENNKGASLYSFLNYWEQQQHSFKISSPENASAIQIMTVHKAKGLEFPVVLFPFADSEIIDLRNKTKMWLPYKTEEFELPLLFDINKDMLHYNEESHKLYHNEIEKKELDSFNVLYVALTRAVEKLFIISSYNAKAKTSTSNLTTLFINYLNSEGLWEENLLEYHIGKLEQKTKDSENIETSYSIPFARSYKSEASHNIVSKSLHLWNTKQKDADNIPIISQLLESLISKEAIVKTVNTFVNQGHIAQKEKETYIEKLDLIIEDENVYPFYSKEYEVFVQRELLSENGVLIQPDRFFIVDNQVSLLNFKQGIENPTDRFDLLQQADTFVQLGYKVKNNVLVYLNQTTNIIKV